ncbi:MAG: OsmC family protein [Anaerolineae bacterium]|nr:OsmC family protein [Anaerolineae bacterium]
MGKTTVILQNEGYQTTIQTRHHTYHADEPIEAGGTDTMVSPIEMALGALGSCVAMTMKMYAERKKWTLEGVEIELESERFKARDYADYEGDERYVHEIRKEIKLFGDLTDEQRARILEIGGKCPVHRLIATPTFFKETLLSDEESIEPVQE